MYTAADLRRDYPSMNPKAGVCPPIEAVWRMNTMTESEFRAQMAAEREKRRAEANARLGEAMAAASWSLAADLRESGVPERYLGVPRDASRNGALSQGTGLWIHGDVGTGKTVMACSIAKGWAAEGNQLRMVSSVRLFSELREAMDRGMEGQVIAKYAGTPLLVLDDLGQEVPSDWALSRLFEIVDSRYGRRMPIVVTTNYSPEHLADRLERSGGTADAIISRLVETTERIRVQGADRRLP